MRRKANPPDSRTPSPSDQPGARPAGPALDIESSAATTAASSSRSTLGERTRCPVCGQPTVATELSCDTLFGRRQQFRRCVNCQLLFDQNPQDFQYEAGFYTENPFLDLKLYLEKGSSLRLFAYLILQAERALQLTRLQGPASAAQGKLWEVGSGAGLLLDLARFRGWKVLGMEPSPEAAKWGKEVLRVPTLVKSLRRRPPLTDADIVIATEVIEHLDSPWEFARALARSLRPDGIALLTTPNAESKELATQGASWVHLGLGYHLVLYSAHALKRVLQDAGFKTVAVNFFEGRFGDERLLAVASKRALPHTVVQTVLACSFEQDREAIEVSSDYLRDVVRRFEEEKNIYWQGALHRLMENYCAAQKYGDALQVAEPLERFLHSQGWTEKYVLDTLEEACRRNDRQVFYDRVPTFIGNFYYLRGVAHLHTRKLEAALRDFRLAYQVMDKLGTLPYKAYEELTGMPPSMHALFHIGHTLLQLGQVEEATAVFDKFVSLRRHLPDDSLGHAFLNQADILQRQGRYEESLARLQQVSTLGQEAHFSPAFLTQTHQKRLETQLQQMSRDVQALEGTRRALESRLAQARGEATELRLNLRAERAKQAALEFQMQQLRFKVVDGLNTLVKEKAPWLHQLGKAAGQRGLDWWRQRKKKELNSAKPTPPSSRPVARVTPARPPRPLPRLSADFAACTIIAKNDLCKARVLASSFRQYHPDAPFVVLVVDRIDGHFDPEQEKFYLIESEQLEIPNPKRFFFQYDLLEASTAVKPYFLAHLLRQGDVKKLVYLDSDILVTRSLDSLSRKLDEHSILLTPHLTAPYTDDSRPGELQILEAGTYNLGFIALRQSEGTSRMLSWWQERLYDKCLMDHEHQMHVDQRWMDLVPGLFEEVFVLRAPGYNVAYWNLHERRVKVQNGDVTVNNQPCYFFHFSGLDPENMGRVSKHQNRFRLEDIGEAKTLFQRYRDLVLAAGWRETKPWSYSYDYFDNGARIPSVARRLYRTLGEKASRFGDPFSATEPGSFFGWLNESADGEKDPARAVTRLWYEIYQQRGDLRQAYPDVMGAHRQAFLEWILTSGRSELGVDPHFVLHDKASPSTRLPSGTPAEVTSVGPRRTAPPASACVEAKLPFGVNVAGYVQSEKGVGEAMRAGLRALEVATIPYVVNNVEDPGSVNAEQPPLNLSEQSPYKVNLIYVNPDAVPYFAERQVSGQQRNGYFRDRYSIGCWNWELSSFPAEWQESFSYLNEVWAPSTFVWECLSRVSPIPVTRVPYAIDLNLKISAEWTRARLGLPPEGFVFLYLFDFHSHAERKNPLGLIQAFKTAFGERQDVQLLIKGSHSSFAPRTLVKLREAAQGANVKLYDNVLPRPAINALMALSDCYVSLHRSEGFGLTPCEAMSWGKPVIATAYGGNVDFMTPNNSFLVKYRLIEIEKDHGPYKKGCVWADPDLEHAAELMRYVYENREPAAAVGQQGREDVYRLLHPRVVADMMRERLSAVLPK